MSYIYDYVNFVKVMDFYFLMAKCTPQASEEVTSHLKKQLTLLIQRHNVLKDEARRCVSLQMSSTDCDKEYKRIQNFLHGLKKRKRAGPSESQHKRRKLH